MHHENNGKELCRSSSSDTKGQLVGRGGGSERKSKRQGENHLRKLGEKASSSLC